MSEALSTPDETIESEITNDTENPRKIRVYKREGDFILELPPGCRCTFGYFNPAASGQSRYTGGPGEKTMRTTALRIYEGTGDKKQLACFLGVSGFRDESIKLKKLVEKVTVERRLADDGEGQMEWGGKAVRELTVSPESEFLDEDVPF